MDDKDEVSHERDTRSNYVKIRSDVMIDNIELLRIKDFYLIL